MIEHNLQVRVLQCVLHCVCCSFCVQCVLQFAASVCCSLCAQCVRQYYVSWPACAAVCVSTLRRCGGRICSELSEQQLLHGAAAWDTACHRTGD